MYQKKNAYIFDFAPERTLTIFDTFANNLHPNPSGDQRVRQENIRTLLNFFPVLGEDAEGRMIELEASQVLTFPQVFKAREVVRRGFLSNLLFANVAGIFRYSEHVKDILDKLPAAKQGKTKKGESIEIPQPPPITDSDGNVQRRPGDRHQPEGLRARQACVQRRRHPDARARCSRVQAATQIAKAVTEKTHEKRQKLKEEYGLTVKQVERDEKRTEQAIKGQVERAYSRARHRQQASRGRAEEAGTEAEAQAVEAKQAEQDKAFKTNILAIVDKTMDEIVPEVVIREETKKEQRRADQTMDDARSHLRGFARTIPMFLMAYGDRDIRLSNFDDYTPMTSSKRSRGSPKPSSGSCAMARRSPRRTAPSRRSRACSTKSVFDQAIQEFLDKKEALADYFDDAQTENIFAYIPQQKTSLVFTPQPVVKMMVDTLEAENPGIFTDPTRRSRIRSPPPDCS